MLRAVLCLALPFLVNAARADESSELLERDLRRKYDGYGEDWIFMPDGNGKPQVAILKGYDEAGTRGIFDASSVTYILYTRDDPENGVRLRPNDTEALKRSGFAASRKTKFITHGWKSSANSQGFLQMKSEYLAHDDCNVILVDWEPLAASTFYLGPMQNTGKVGRNAARFIDFLEREAALRPRDVHFVGHSLGAHVAGNAGSSLASGRLGRITGLDPALPGFHLLSSKSGRLDAEDAEFVDVIHSCGGVLGYFQPIGRADFYPNGGTAVQPGCCCVPELINACSHGRSYVYFTESINSDVGFTAKKCETWDYFMNGTCKNSDVVFMGEHVDPTASGSFFLRTRSTAPFAYVPEMTDNDV